MSCQPHRVTWGQWSCHWQEKLTDNINLAVWTVDYVFWIGLLSQCLVLNSIQSRINIVMDQYMWTNPLPQNMTRLPQVTSHSGDQNTCCSHTPKFYIPDWNMKSLCYLTWWNWQCKMKLVCRWVLWSVKSCVSVKPCVWVQLLCAKSNQPASQKRLLCSWRNLHMCRTRKLELCLWNVFGVIWNWTRPRVLVQNQHTRELISAQKMSYKHNKAVDHLK